MVVRELHHVGVQMGDISEKFQVPRSTIHD